MTLMKISKRQNCNNRTDIWNRMSNCLYQTSIDSKKHRNLLYLRLCLNNYYKRTPKHWYNTRNTLNSPHSKRKMSNNNRKTTRKL